MFVPVLRITLVAALASLSGCMTASAVSAGVILVSLWPINALAERLHGTTVPEVQLRLHLERVDLVGEVSGVLAAHKVEIGSIGTQRVSRETYRADLSLRSRTSQSVLTAIEAISRIPGVEIVSTSQVD